MSGNLKLNTPSAGSVTLSTADTASNVTVTIPAATDTATLNAQTQTLTNKTLVASGSNTVEATSGPTSTQLAGMRNKIINGAMLVWQRGTSGFTTNNNYSADRWFLSSGGSITIGARSTDAPTTYKYSLFIVASAYPQVNQRIESANCNDLSGGTVIVSFWARNPTAGTLTLSTQLYYASASDNFETITSIATVSNTITTSWAQYTATFTSLPSGVTNGIQLSIFGNSGSTTAFDITGVQLEKGATATPFENRLYGTEFDLCRRYCEVYSGSSEADVIPQGMAQTDVSNRPETMLQYYLKRAAPTITVASGTAIIYQTMSNTGVGITGYAGALVGTGLRGSNLFFNCSSGVTQATLSAVGYIIFSGSNSITVSAEL